MKKYSYQREVILSELRSVSTHPTATAIYDMVRAKIPNISLGTVYRNLSMLSDYGIILKITAGDGIERFDGNPNPHYHFCCHECGSVSDLDLPPFQELDLKVQKLSGNIVQKHSLIFYGICSDCLHEKEVNKNAV